METSKHHRLLPSLIGYSLKPDGKVLMLKIILILVVEYEQVKLTLN